MPLSEPTAPGDVRFDENLVGILRNGPEGTANGHAASDPESNHIPKDALPVANGACRSVSEASCDFRHFPWQVFNDETAIHRL